MGRLGKVGDIGSWACQFLPICPRLCRQFRLNGSCFGVIVKQMTNAKDIANVRVLVVDDEDFMRSMIKRLLGVIGIATDISKLKKMEKELLKAKKFEAASVFAGGICHDFNNLLAVIIGYADLALNEIDKTSPVYSMLQEIVKSSLRFKELIQSFLSLSSTGTPGKGIFPLEKIIKNAACAPVDGDKVHCEYLFAENLWQVKMDPSQVGQVVANVVKNSEEALPEGGLIRITTDNIDARAAARETHVTMEKEKYVRVIVEDNGSGIAEKNLSRIFDPYFSTKKRGNVKGMGLGLTSAYSVILKHEGHIQVESKLGVGTSVIIYLPAE